MTSASQTSLSGDTGWALVGNVVYAACQWAILALIVRFTTAADVGGFCLGLAVTAPVMMLMNLQLRALQATDATRQNRFGTYLGLRLLTTTVGLVIVAAIGVATGYPAGTLSVILAVGLAKAVEAVSDVVFGALQQRGRFRTIAVSMCVKGVVSVLVVALALVLTGNVAVAALTMALGWGVVLAAYDVPMVASLEDARPVFRLDELAGLVSVAWPMGVVMGLNSLTVNVPRYAVEAAAGTAALGQFAALAYLFVAGSQIVLAAGAALSPRLANAFVSDRASYRYVSSRALVCAGGLGVLCVVAAALCGGGFLRLAYGPAYGERADLFVWLAAAAGLGFVSNVLGVSVTAARRFREQAFMAPAVLVACMLASRLLVGRHGLVGAAWAIMIAELTRLAILGAIYWWASADAEAATPGRYTFAARSAGALPGRR